MLFPMRRFAVLMCALAFLALPAGASARECKAPPGTAAVDQYCETIPSAGGEAGSGTPESRTAVGVPGETARELQESPEGRALLQLVDEEARGKGGNGASRERDEAQSDIGGLSASSEPSDNPLNAIRAAVESGDTVGTGFIVLLLAVTLIISALGWARYRRNSAG
jgi:hypothetical protein